MRSVAPCLVLLVAACASPPRATPDGGRGRRDAGRALDARAALDAGAIDGGAPADAARDASASIDAALPVDGGRALDPFGIAELHPSLPGGRRWTSEHWGDGTSRRLTSAGARDARDPTAWSTLRGSGRTLAMEIDGDGVMSLFGDQPRLYVTPSGELFGDLEVTLYYRRVSDSDVAYGGAVIGMRSGANGHSDGNCDAHTYYARLRHDGAHDFAKELQHPDAAAIDRASVYSGGLPRDTWIGVKAVVYTRADGAVVLEHYRDTTGGAGGGTWELMGTRVVDDGGWSAPQTAACARPDDYVITDRGIVLVRSTMGDAGRADYRWVTIREIAPPE